MDMSSMIKARVETKGLIAHPKENVSPAPVIEELMGV